MRNRWTSNRGGPERARGKRRPICFPPSGDPRAPCPWPPSPSRRPETGGEVVNQVIFGFDPDHLCLSPLFRRARPPMFDEPFTTWAVAARSYSFLSPGSPLSRAGNTWSWPSLWRGSRDTVRASPVHRGERRLWTSSPSPRPEARVVARPARARPLGEDGRRRRHIAEGDLTQRVDAHDPADRGREGRPQALNSMLAHQGSVRDPAQSEERLRRFLADASHELRMLLTSIRGVRGIVPRGAEQRPEDLKLATRRTGGGFSDGNALVEDLLLLARV